MKKVLFPFWAWLVIASCVFQSCTEAEPPKQQEPEDKEEKQEEPVPPTVATKAPKFVSKNNITIEGLVLEKGSAAVTNRGFCWNLTSEPSMEDNFVKAASVKTTGEFNAEITGLEPGTTYYIAALAESEAGIAFGETLEIMTNAENASAEPTVYLDSTSFDSEENFKANWNMYYPWGQTHNGSAKMLEERVTLEENGVLLIEAKKDYPQSDLAHSSGAIHFNKQMVISDNEPVWVVSGDFQCPTAKGTWPAFWVNGAWSWPPETDIMEFKGNNTNWQNTVSGPGWWDQIWSTEKTVIENADQWHNYKAEFQKISNDEVQVKYFIDGEHTATHTREYYHGGADRFNLIINLQMEGSSGAPGPDYAEFRARNIYMASYKSVLDLP